MSYLDKLLEGVKVEWGTLGEVADYEQPTKYLVKSNNYKDNFPTPVLTAGKTFILGYTDETDGIYKASKKPVIIFDDFTTANKWVNFDFKAKSSAMKMITSKNGSTALLKYIYYWLNTLLSGLVDGDHKRQWISNYSNKQIPIPPLEVQKEIVRILDKFTELTAELTARKRQYNYYREQLLSFEEREVEWRTLGDIILSLKTGLNPRKNFLLNTEEAQGFYVTIREIQGGKIVFLDKTDRVNDDALELINNRSNLEIGDILFSGTGTIGKTAVIESKPLNWNIKEGVYVIKPNLQIVNSRYISYLLNSEGIVKEYNKKIVGSPVASLPMSDLKKLLIPIPPLPVQKKIVRILDKFDILTTSISEGLPKEIELRKKQYEYYRDLLLTFPNNNIES